jgi:SpoU rRNA methylase family enzyme
MPTLAGDLLLGVLVVEDLLSLVEVLNARVSTVVERGDECSVRLSFVFRVSLLVFLSCAGTLQAGSLAAK